MFRLIAVDVVAGHRPAERSTDVLLDGSERLHWIRRVDGGHHEHVIPPHHRRAPAAARDVHLPRDVLGRGPVVGQRRIVGDHTAPGAPKSWPVLRVHHGPWARNDDEQDEQAGERHRPSRTGMSHHTPADMILGSHPGDYGAGYRAIRSCVIVPSQISFPTCSATVEL